MYGSIFDRLFALTVLLRVKLSASAAGVNVTLGLLANAERTEGVNITLAVPVPSPKCIVLCHNSTRRPGQVDRDRGKSKGFG